MMQRRISQPITIGGMTVGGDAPIVVQSMAKTDTRDARATIRQIRQLERCGCQIVRVAVPDREAADALPAIKKAIRIPLIADIHFDHRLALAAIDAGVDGLRLNPGNIRDPQHIKKVVLAAKQHETPIRIGVNAGSLPPQIASHLDDFYRVYFGCIAAGNFDRRRRQRTPRYRHRRNGRHDCRHCIGHIFGARIFCGGPQDFPGQKASGRNQE